MIFDSHAHYDDEDFDVDREAFLADLPNHDVCGVINCGCSMDSSRFSVELAEKYDYIYAAVGIHPHDAEKTPFTAIDELRELSQNEKTVAIGEIGLDYHYDFSPRDVQKEWFERQLILAKELELPVIVHDREAHEDTWNLLKKYKPEGVVHCFSGSVEMARDILSIGMYIGLGGAVTFKNAKKPVEVAKYIPLDRLLTETDAPYMTPVPFRGKRNTSALIPYSAEKIAEVRGITAEEVLEAGVQNAKRLFKKIK